MQVKQNNQKPKTANSPEEWRAIFENSVERYENSDKRTYFMRIVVKILYIIMIIFMVGLLSGGFRLAYKFFVC